METFFCTSSGTLAEATRFELVKRLLVWQFSKLLVSATHPHFRVRKSKFEINKEENLLL